MTNKKFYGISMATTFGQNKGEIAYFTTAEKALDYIKAMKPVKSFIEKNYRAEDLIEKGQGIYRWDNSVKDFIMIDIAKTVIVKDMNENLQRTFRGESGDYFKIIEHTFED